MARCLSRSLPLFHSVSIFKAARAQLRCERVGMCVCVRVKSILHHCWPWSPAQCWCIFTCVMYFIIKETVKINENKWERGRSIEQKHSCTHEKWREHVWTSTKYRQTFLRMYKRDRDYLMQKIYINETYISESQHRRTT